MKRTMLAAGGLVLVLTASACGGGEEAVVAPSAAPSLAASPVDDPSIYPVPGSPTPKLNVPGQGNAENSGPGNGQVSPGAVFPNENIKRNGSTVDATVDGQSISLSFDTIVEYPFYEPPDGQFNLTWADANNNALSIGGKLAEGTRKTSSKLGLSLALAAPKFDTFGSGDGSCSITLDRIENRYLAGSFQCGKLTGSNGGNLTGASGTFEARF